jgi:opacity protein-like surface antigen
MKRAVLVIGLLALAAGSAAAQWTGMPVWNSPKSGSGLTISGDYGVVGTATDSSRLTALKGNAFGGRASLGLGPLTLTAGVASFKSDSLNSRTTTYGGQVALRLIGGSLLPVAVNLQGGVAGSGSVTSGGPTNLPSLTRATAAVGISVPLPTPGVSIEPYFSPGIRFTHRSDATTGASTNQTKFGFAVGANFGFSGPFGIHAAYDYEKTDTGNLATFGVGAHLGFHLPLGM